MKKLIAITLTIMVAFSFMPGLAESAHAAAKKPAKVKFAKCTSTKSSATLKWKKAKNAKKYEVYQLKAKKYKKIKTVKKIMFTVKKLKANTVYKFKVRGVNGKKNGKFSAVKKIRTKKSNNTNVTPTPQGSISDVYFANNSTSVKVGKSVTAKLLIEVKKNAKPVASNFTVRTNNGNVAASVIGIGGGVNESYYASVKITGKAAGSSVVTVSGYGFSDSIDVYINANTSSNNTNTSTNNGGNTNTSSGNENGNGQTNGVALQSISFNKSSMEMAKGDYQTLNVSYSPSNTTVDKKNVKYSVSDSNVLSINSSGSTSVSITAAGYGTATVTATLDGKTARCTVTVPKPGLKYTYEFYKLKEATLFSSDTNRNTQTNKLLVLTTNPDPDEVGFGLVGEDSNVGYPPVSDVERPSKFTAVFNCVLEDMNIPDQINGKYVYIVMFDFKVSGNVKYKVYEWDRYTDTEVVSENAITITTTDYETAYNNWIDSYLDRYNAGTPRERYKNILAAIENEAYYSCGTTMYSLSTSFKLNNFYPWQKVGGSYYIDSLVLQPMIDIANRLGATKAVCCTDVGMSYEDYHWRVIVSFDDGVGDGIYSFCPPKTKIKEIEYRTLSLNDYEQIAKFTK